MSCLTVNTPFTRSFAAPLNLHSFSKRGIQLHPRMAGNYPRIPGITLGPGLVHYLLRPATHRLSLLAQSRRLAPLLQQAAAKRRTACPSSDGTTHDEDGLCFEDRRDCSPWTTLVEGPTARELSLPRLNSAARLHLTVPCSLLSLVRFLFRRWSTNHCYSSANSRGLPTFRQAASRTLR
jgi:hypothetical protein